MTYKLGKVQYLDMKFVFWVDSIFRALIPHYKNMRLSDPIRYSIIGMILTCVCIVPPWFFTQNGVFHIAH